MNVKLTVHYGQGLNQLSKMVRIIFVDSHLRNISMKLFKIYVVQRFVYFISDSQTAPGSRES